MPWRLPTVLAAIFWLTLFIPGCRASQPAISQRRHPLPEAQAVVHLTTYSLNAPARCRDYFVTHTLDHLTTTADGMVRMFQANGAGMASNDLDNDGHLDLFLGSESGPNTILWNEGALTFTKRTLGQGPTRAVTLIDVDADGLRDIVLTTNIGAINYWHNQGDRTFVQRVLAGVAYPAYVINWGDLDRDGDLDLVTASYDAGFLTDRGNSYLLEQQGGVFIYERQGDGFQPTRLETEAQALAVALVDLNRDQRLDILVGNDFAVRDQAWLRSLAGWEAAAPFAVTTYSTMSIDQGDMNNDGVPELFATDMNPYDIAPATLAAWLPVIKDMETDHQRTSDDPQEMANVLQEPTRYGDWRDLADQAGVAATGWSWSGKFGDLDNDGYLDLYVVNGMIEERIFAHLPNHELVEHNQVFRNLGGRRFAPMAAWQLGSSASGRSMIMADLDEDGDLEIVVNNLRAPAQLFANQLCGGQALEVDLQWPAVQNRAALGARLRLYTSQGAYSRDVRAASGYLAGDPARLHFGLPPDAIISYLEIRWPDGYLSEVTGLQPGTRVVITRQ
ncbi:MAG: CRTAC1 family protein [Caldilineaceae bacterium]